MELTSVTTINNFTAVTPNGRYRIECYITAGRVERMSVLIYSVSGDTVIGNIYRENGTTSCNFPTGSPPVRLAPLFEDFDGFVGELEKHAGETQAK